MTVTDRGGDAATSALAASVGLTDADLLAMYRTVALARAVDERMWILNRAGRISFVISGQGHEGAQVGLAWPLRQGHDWVAPYYRSIATCLAFGHDRARHDARPVREGHRPVVGRAADAGPLRAPPSTTSCRCRRPWRPRSSTPSASRWPRGSARRGPGRGRDHGRGRSNQGDVHEGAQLRGHPQAAVRVRRREQRLRDQRAGGEGAVGQGRGGPRVRATGSPASSSTGPTCSPATRPAARRSTGRAPAAARRSSRPRSPG